MSREDLRSEDIYIDRYDTTSSEYDSDADCEYMPNIDDFSDSSDSSLSIPKKRPRHTTVTTNNDNTLGNVLPGTHETQEAESADEISESEVRPMQVSLSQNILRHDPGNQSDVVWYNVTGNLESFEFNVDSGFNIDIVGPNYLDKSPTDYFLSFITPDIINKIVEQTNLYAYQCIIKGTLDESISKHSLLATWTDTNPSEILSFIALIIWMGLDNKPQISDYWSKLILYKNNFVQEAKITRNRFRLLLSMLHFSDNENSIPGNKLYKIEWLIQALNEQYHKACTVGRKMCIDESMVPFRGRLSFRQYIPNKRHRYGIKLFKVCIDRGYTYTVKVYVGKEGNSTPTGTVTENVVLDLTKDLVNEGRELYTDNFYTSVNLARILLQKKTHLVGTLRKTRRNNPTAVTKAKLKKGEIKMQQSNSNVIVSKWKDKRDILFLTTKSVPEMTAITTKRGKIVEKPSTIIDYNAVKGFIDQSDQMASYNSPIRRSVKWYRKIAFELIANTTIVNAHVMYTTVQQNKMDITEFREQLVLGLIKKAQSLSNAMPNSDDTSEDTPQMNHIIMTTNKRSRCSSCYEKMKTEFGRGHAVKHAKQVKTMCPGCNPSASMCTDCFFMKHVVKAKK